MNNTGVFNATVCIAGILLLAIHLIYLLIKKNKSKDEKNLMEFFIFTIIHFASYLSYTLIKVNYTSNAFIIAFYTTFYMMNNVEAFLLFSYASSYIKTEKKREKRIFTLNVCVFCVFILLDIINIFTGIFFTASGGEYVRSKGMIVSQGYQFVAFACVFMVAATNKKLSAREKAAFGIYCFLPLVAIVLQNIFKGYAIAYASIIVAIEILFIFLDVQKNMALDEKVTILDSMAGIYDNVNLLDFAYGTETNLRSPGQKSESIDLHKQSHTLMNQKLINTVVPDHLEAFAAFTDIRTVRNRLANKKIISADFTDVHSGWFRAQYISVESGADGIPNIVIYTTRNIDEEKQKEEHLIRISLTDDMTRLFNRRCYDEDLNKIKSAPLKSDFVIFSIDVNGLKTVNDTKGHAAGDELVKAAADCLTQAFENCGKVYRTGGDEFMAIVHTSEPEQYRGRIHQKASEWHGTYSDTLSVSVGYAALAENAGAGADALERLADKEMYREKENHYTETGLHRRVHIPQ